MKAEAYGHGRTTSRSRRGFRSGSKAGSSGGLRLLRTGLIAFAAIALSGCSTAGYLLQAGKGQWEISNRARPIETVLLDERVDPRVRQLLSEIPRIKKFGEVNGLKATSNYVEYVDLKRPAVVWVVSASERLKFEPKRWGFPIVGSFTYLGWFDEGSARKYAKELEREEDLDVDVRGSSAYSTLGWFRDPVLSTMIAPGRNALGSLVNVVLHESVHATLYVKDQSYFNESVASFVADRLTPEYLNAHFGADSEEAKAYVASSARQLKASKDLQKAYMKLKAIYDSDESDSDKIEKKKEILSALQKELGYSRPINNATLIQYRTYGVGVAEYEALFRSCGKNWERFWTALNGIDEDSFTASQQEDLAAVILPLAREGCADLSDGARG